MADNVDATRELTDPTDRETDRETEGGIDGCEADGDERTTAAALLAAPAVRRDVRTALTLALVIATVISGLAGWLGYRSVESRRAQQEYNVFLQVGRQGALNLTTISYTQADADVQRILSGATGSFYDDFQKRAPAFVDVVKQAQSKSEGAVTEAGVESTQGDRAQVLVAVTVKTSTAGVDEPRPRLWRMRIGVQKTSQGAKVSDVAFVP